MSLNNDDWTRLDSAVASQNMEDVLNAVLELSNTDDPRAIGLLERAGDNTAPLARKLPIKFPEGSLTFDEFRNKSISKIKIRLGRSESAEDTDSPQNTGAAAGDTTVFISYNHGDAAPARKLALQLSQESDVGVCIDEWEMDVGDSLLDRIEAAIDQSSFLVVLLSANSIGSKWVRTELKYAYQKEEELGRTFILPVLLDDCKLPIFVVDRLYIDLRTPSLQATGVQRLLNKIKGIEPFSAKLRRVLTDGNPASPYNEHVQREGRQILLELGQYSELEVLENQKWLLWELIRRILSGYTCTLKISKDRGCITSQEGYRFEIIDRWNETGNAVFLTEDEFRKGLWEVEINLTEGAQFNADALEFVGGKRLSLDGRFNPDVQTNPFLGTAHRATEPVLRSMEEVVGSFGEDARQSFLFDFQSIVLLPDQRTVRLVVGSGSSDLCYAHSPMLGGDHSAPGNGWAVMELFDPFFRSLKYTTICPSHLGHHFGADVDLMAGQMEVIMGLD